MRNGGWCPFVTRRDGPPGKVGYSFAGESGPKRGEVDHSAEGWWWGIYSALDGPLSKSWHFTIGLDRTEQHYPIRAHCWHAGDTDDDGGVSANLDLIGKEHLGLQGQPLNAYQEAMSLRISRWCGEQERRTTFQRFDGWAPNESGVWLLAEHNEVSDTPTACPSNRIPWAKYLRRLNMVSREDFEKLRDDMDRVNRFQNELLMGQKFAIDGAISAINYLAQIAVNQERRLRSLETS